MKATIISFGFKYGEMPTAQFVIDVRHVRNPHRDRRLRYLSGLDDAVVRDVVSSPEYEDFFATIRAMMSQGLRDGGVVAFGCTGGRHRSVTFARALETWLGKRGWEVSLIHRDVNRKREQAA